MQDSDESEQLNFLLNVLQSVSDSNSDSNVVYPFLQQNLTLLNDELIEVLKVWVRSTYAQVDRNAQKSIARTLSDFGDLIQEFPLGNKAVNVELSIACYDLALEIFTVIEDSEIWAYIQYSLGIVYKNRIGGNRAENLEQSIEFYLSALEVLTKQDSPINWATTQHNLGITYKNRIRGDRAENLENSISCYLSAMEIYTKEDLPLDWANTQNSLGNAYNDRIRGDRADNLEQSINCHTSALEVYTKENLPLDRAMSQTGLGNTYRNRIRGDRAENLEKSIQYYASALEVYTKETLPIEWAMAQHNLGLAYSEKIRGDRAENLELSIQCYASALQVRTKESLPLDWAMSQHNLGLVYLFRIRGDVAENLEKSIQYHVSALEVYPKETLPIEWAMSQHNLAVAYRKRIKGDRAENLEKSIQCCVSALEVRTKENLPLDWAMSQHNLANAYLSRIGGDRAENLEKSIQCYTSAMKVYTKENLLIEWARSQDNLGLAYSNRIRGDRAENLEKSIECHASALEVITKKNLPLDWAGSQNNLANAYLFRIKGDRSKNIELSIQHLSAALEIHTKENLPIQWANTQHNLANAYLFRIAGDKAENIKLSIQCCTFALEIYTREDLPIQWAGIQTALANAYSSQSAGNKPDNLEMSIQYYKSALEVWDLQKNDVSPPSPLLSGFNWIVGRLLPPKPLPNKPDLPLQWANTQNNLGIAYVFRSGGDRDENIELSIHHFSAALEIHTKENLPIQWANTQHNLANAYSKRIRGVKANNLKHSIACYEASLEINTSQNLPIECLRAARNLGDLYFNQGNWQEAISNYETAMQAAETSRSWSVNDHERQRVLTEALCVYENAIQCAVNLTDYKKAIEYTERVRSRQLVELIASKDLYSDAQVPAEIQAYLAEYQQLNQEVDNLRDSGEDRSGTTKTRRTSQDFRKISEKIAKAEERKQILYNLIRAYDPVLAGQIAVAPISHGEIQQLITSPHTAILTFYSTNDDTHIFILKHDREPELFTCKNQGKKELLQWLIANWRDPYQKNTARWLTKMPEVLAEIATRLQLPQLIANHLSGIQELVLVPHLLLHQIPFAALPILGSEQLLGEKFTIRCIPSCQILQYCQQRPPINANIQGIVEDADDTLMGARYEGQKIAEIYSVSDSDRLRGKTQATVANYRQLLGRVNRLHSSHHASFSPNKPLESALFLADGKITLGDLLLGERYQNLDEIFLSACETHVGEYTFTDDVTTITTGFLCIGARSVQSTLWSVDDLVTAIFDVFYHQERREGFNRAVSLKRAQVRLRYLSGEEFRINHYPELKQFLDKFLPSELDRIDQKIEQLEIAQKTAIGDDKEEISKELKQLEIRYQYLDTQIKSILNDYCKQAYPFAAPFYWAGFICQGMA